MKWLIYIRFQYLVTTLLVLMVVSRISFAQLEVQVLVSPPYPTHLSDFKAIESNIFITVRNTTSSSHSFIFSGSLRNEDVGMSVSTDPANPATACFSIGPGETRNFTGTDLEETLDPDRLIYQGTTRERIRGDEALPEGRYVLCLRAMDCLDPTQPLSPIPDEFNMGCASYDMSYVDPPVLINPDCETTPVIPLSQSTIPITWSWMPPARGYDEINFNIKLVEVDPPSRNPFDALNSAPPFFETDVINVTSYNLMIPDDLILEEGQKYVFQITASDPTGEIVFKNEGRSIPCTFWYGAPGDINTRLIPLYPQEGDILPFETIPLIGAVDQLGDNTINESYITFDQEGASAERRVSERLRHKERSVTPWDYDRLVLEAFPDVYRANCTWQMESSIYTGERDVNLSTDLISFGRGMPQPELQSPADDSEISAGSISFSWILQKPGSLLPPIDLSTFSDSLGTLTVDERWILEVSDSSTFDEIIQTATERIELSISDPADSMTLINDLYGEISRNISISTAGKYFWRIKWLSDPSNTESEAYSVSPVRSFSVTGGGTLPEDVPATTSVDGPCVGDCEMAELTDRTPVSALSEGDNISIRNFNLQITLLTSASNPFSGEGVITIPFMNNLQVNVTFEDLQINASGQVFSGSATAVEDVPGTTLEDISATVAGEEIAVPRPGFADTDEFEALFTGGERLISGFTGDRAIGMPVGLDNEVAGIPYTIGIVGMSFTPRRATFDALMATDIPALGNKMIALGANDVCLTPSGLGETGRLYLARDWELVQAGGTEFAFTGAETASSLDEITYAEWDCNGFKCLRVNGEITFPREKLVKENDAGEILPEQVTGTINVESCRGMNIMARIDIDPFQVSGFKGWGFHISTAWWDMSDEENPVDLSFPEGYENTSIMRETGDGSMEPIPGMINTWKGFFLQLAQIKTPAVFSGGSTRGSANVEDLIVDETGFTANINVEDLIDYSSGNVSGWAFSLDRIEVQFIQNSFESGGFNGKLGTPLFEGDDHLEYNSLLSLTEEDDIHYEFNVEVGSEPVDVTAWKARLTFNPDSRITFEYNEEAEDPAHLTATLNGTLGLDAAAINKIPGLNFTGIEFQNLWVSTEDPYFDVGDSGVDGSIFGFSSPQKEASGFPVSIRDIQLASNEGTFTKPGLQFTTELNLTEDIAAELTFGIYAELTLPGAGEKFDLDYDETKLQAISVHANLKSVVIDGQVIFYEESTKEGVYGSLSVSLPIGVTAEMECEFGKSDLEGGFRYWYVYGLVTFSGGIDIFSGFALYGLGGGVYHNMTRPPDDAIRQPITVNAEGESRNPAGMREESSVDPGSVYEPDKGTYLGIKVQAIMGVKGEEKAFNMDVIIEAEVARARGGGSRLQSLLIHGEGNVMTDINEEDPSSPIQVTIRIEFQNRPPDKFVHGNVGIRLKIGEILYGCGEDYSVVDAEFHADFSDPSTEPGSGKDWWFYIGEMHPDRRACLKIDLKILVASLETYFMVGTRVPSELPPLPDRVRDLLGGSGSDRYEESSGDVTTSANMSMRTARSGSQQRDYAEGKGFATGAHLSAEVDITFIIIYAYLGANIGFDFSLVQHTTPCLETGSVPGINGYYGKGQVYAGLEGEVGIKVDLWFIKKKIPFLYLGAAAALQGKLPNPNWFQGRVGLRYSVLGGLISGQTNMKIEFGTECTLMSDYNPFAGIEFIDRVEPGQDEEVEIFTNPSAYFNLEINEILAIPNSDEDEDDPGGVTEYQPFVDSFTLTNVDNGEVDEGNYTVLEDGLIAEYTIGRGLQGRANYEASITVKAWELLKGGGRRLVTIPDTVITRDGKTTPIGPWEVWEETKISEFSTKPEPTEIPEDQIVYSYPVKRQNYFMTGETQDLQGVIKLKNPMDRLFDNYIDLDRDGENDDNELYEDYYVRYINVETGDQHEEDLNYDMERAPRYITLPIPAELENDAYYAIQLFARQRIKPVTNISATAATLEGEEETETTTESGGLVGTSISSGGIQGSFDESKYADDLEPRPLGYRFGDEFYSTVVAINVKTLPGDKVSDREHLLYSYYFGISRYNTLAAKLRDLDLVPEYVTYSGFKDYFKVSSDVEEPFERYDFYGYHKGGERVLPPLIENAARPTEIDFFDQVDRLYDAYFSLISVNPLTFNYNRFASVRDRRTDRNVTAPIPFRRIPDMPHRGGFQVGMPPYRAIFPDPDNLKDPISDYELKQKGGVSTDIVATWIYMFTRSSTNLGEIVFNYNLTKYVKSDAILFKNDISDFLSTSTKASAFANTGWLLGRFNLIFRATFPTYNRVLLRNHPETLGKLWWVLFQSPNDYSLTEGDYRILFRYRYPNATGSSRIIGTRSIRDFNYRVIVPTEFNFNYRFNEF